MQKKTSPEDVKDDENSLHYALYSCMEKKRDVSDMRRGAGEKI